MKICPKQIMNHVQPDDKDMILSCLVSCLFMKGDAYLCQNDITTILSTLNSIPTLCEYIFKTEYGLIKKSVKGILIQEVFQQIHYFHHSPKKILHGCIAYFIRRAKNHLKWLYWNLYCASFYPEISLLNIESNWFLLSRKMITFCLSLSDGSAQKLFPLHKLKKEHSWERRDRGRIRENERKKCEGKFSVSKIKLSAPFTILASDYKKSIISHKDNERYHTNNILLLMQWIYKLHLLILNTKNMKRTIPSYYFAHCSSCLSSKFLTYTTLTSHHVNLLLTRDICTKTIKASLSAEIIGNAE